MLGERIRDIRKLNQLNQTEFSQRIGVSQGTLSELEQNKYNPSLETIQAIIKEFNVNATWLLFGVENENELGIIKKDEKLNAMETSLIKNSKKLSSLQQEEILKAIDLKKADK